MGRTRERRRSLPLAKSDALAVVRETIENLGYECVLTRFVTEQHDSTLQIFIDSIGGILVKDCEIVSRTVVKKIDEMDPAFLEKFSIEVSSPGIERPLFTIDDYIRFQGKTVRVRLREPVEGRRQVTGAITAVSDEIIRIEEIDTRDVLLVPFSIITNAHIVYKEP